MVNDDEWELVGGVYRPKPKGSGIGGWFFAIAILIFLIAIFH